MNSERRKYIRLDSVFPVSFKLLSLDGKNILSDLLQGFTNNIGEGGICLSINNLKSELARLVETKEVKIFLDIEIPLAKKPISAMAQIAWVQDTQGEPHKYIIGLSYEQISHKNKNRLLRYAYIKKWSMPAALVLIILLAAGLAFNGYMNLKLIQGNKTLVEQLVRIMQDSTVARKKMDIINKDKKGLELKIQALELRIQVLDEERFKAKQEAGKISELNASIEKLIQEKSAWQNELIRLQYKETSLAEELLNLAKKKTVLEKANIDKMYRWLIVHQNPRTGLVTSFEGDKSISDWAFIYDQSLVAQAYTYFGDFECARKIFEFFLKKAKREGKKFFNAYYTGDGQPSEYIVHSGPNIWLGIAVIQYAHKTKDNKYLVLAEEIAQEIMDLQAQDIDAGIRGGPDVSWYSTEHNLDAYAFFNMLYKVTGNTHYAQVRDKVLGWLVKHTYDGIDIPIRRGKGDSTIATDTYAWAIAAVGPEKLEELGMNPDVIIGFAEENCAVEVYYSRPEGKRVKIKGFDFAAQRNVARGGVVSSEWTAQMVIAFKIAADFYYKKGLPNKTKAYAAKADEYLGELANMIISSPSPSGQGESCLPYATEGSIDTGHGWITPKGNSTGSVSGTAYTLFAYYGYNPLELKE